MEDKSEASKLVKNFCHMVNIQFTMNMKIIKSDNGSEFTSGPMKESYGDQGVIHQTICVDTLQHNGRVERKHWHNMNVAKALHFQANLQIEFWRERVLATAYLISRTSTPILHVKLLMRSCSM